MSDVVISVENLSKEYRLGTIGHRTLRQDFARWWAKKRGRPDPYLRIGQKDYSNQEGEKVWALRDINMQVKQGEIVGIIGRNGAGKSTLLKILSRITAPTSGEVKIKGRIGSLLEVGTGFHPELTGRENVFLNGAILGMTKEEVASKFDEIVDFSGVEQYIDTPVKRYSSGMHVRLAFAVAAHLDPEILVVDEVLAVGDFNFQKKCLGKMEDVSHAGRTVLFVSHQMSSITRLCPRTLLIGDGYLVLDADTAVTVGEYIRPSGFRSGTKRWESIDNAPGNDIVKLTAVRTRDTSGYQGDSYDIRLPIAVDVEYVVLEPGHVLSPNLHFYNEEGTYLFVTLDSDKEWKRRPKPKGRYISTVWIPGNYLSEGSVFVTTAISTQDPHRVHVYEPDTIVFQVTDSLEGDSARGDYGGLLYGAVRPLLEWTTHGPDASPGLRFLSSSLRS